MSYSPPVSTRRGRLLWCGGHDRAWRYGGVHAAIGGHVGPVFEEVPTGTFMIRKVLPQQPLTISRWFYGSSTHGSQPHKGKDPFMAAATFILTTQVLKSREVIQITQRSYP